MPDQEDPQQSPEIINAIVDRASDVLDAIDRPWVIAVLMPNTSGRVVSNNMDKWQTPFTAKGGSVLSDLTSMLRATVGHDGTGRRPSVAGNVTLVQQLDDNGCGIACIAMLMDMPYEAVAASPSVDSYGMSVFEFKRALKALKIAFEHCVDSELRFSGLYAVQVPSLNKPAGTHFILVYCSDDYMWIYDPNQGREGKRFYTRDATLLNLPDGLGHSLGSYGAVLRVAKGGKLDYI